MRNAAKMRRSVVAARDLPAGHTLSADDLACKRPGTGIAPAEWNTVVGSRLREPVGRDTLLRWSLLERNDH
jgi:sialic acid synthase SpsE